MNLIEIIKKHNPVDEEEDAYQKSFIQFLDKFPENDWGIRENLIGHLTSSAWVVNKDRSKVLFAFHNIYQSWAWLGGHADGDIDLLYVAQKETKEEAGIQRIKPLLEKPIDLSVQTVLPHIRRSQFVPSHLHFNAVYLIEADEDEILKHQPEENTAVAWIKKEELIEMVSEDFIKPTYLRIMKKIELL